MGTTFIHSLFKFRVVSDVKYMKSHYSSLQDRDKIIDIIHTVAQTNILRVTLTSDKLDTECFQDLK